MYSLKTSAQARCDIRPNFKRSLTGLNSEFCIRGGYHTKVKEFKQAYYLLRDGESIVGFISFPRGGLGNAERSFIAIAPRSTLARRGST